MLVYGSPEPLLPAHNADYDLIQVLFISGCWKTAADLVGKALAELECPLLDRVVTYQDASGHHHLLAHTQVERKSEVQPNGVADHFRRKGVSERRKRRRSVSCRTDSSIHVTLRLS